MLKHAATEEQVEPPLCRPASIRGQGRDVSPENELLRSLLPEECARILPATQRVNLSLGQVLYEPGARLEYAYFPLSSVLSCVYTTQEGATVQMALVGDDGVAGLGILLGREVAGHRIVVQIAGDSIKIPAHCLKVEFARGGGFQRVILRYAQTLLTQISQTAVCNRLHSVEQRLCRWLLECDDRVHGTEIRMTQENIANMLGVRREGVTLAAGRLQDSGLIQYSRGHIRIVDRKGLEMVVCECYQAVEEDFGRGQYAAREQYARNGSMVPR